MPTNTSIYMQIAEDVSRRIIVVPSPYSWRRVLNMGRGLVYEDNEG